MTEYRAPLLAWGILILVLAALWLGPGTLIASRVATLADRIERNDALSARYEALATRASAMAEDLRRIDTAPPERALLLRGASETQALAGLQEQVKQILGDSGAAVSGLQPRPARMRGPWRMIGLTVQFTADTPALQKALHALEAGRPLVVVETMQVRTRGQAGTPRPLEVSIEIAAFADGEAR